MAFLRLHTLVTWCFECEKLVNTFRNLKWQMWQNTVLCTSQGREHGGHCEFATSVHEGCHLGQGHSKQSFMFLNSGFRIELRMPFKIQFSFWIWFSAANRSQNCNLNFMEECKMKLSTVYKYKFEWCLYKLFWERLKELKVWRFIRQTKWQMELKNKRQIKQ